jgi:Uma2 family endonuclease
MTPEQYLAFERASDTKHELVDGYLYNMSGASNNHIHISVNLVRELSRALKGKPCFAMSSDMKVNPKSHHSFFYPDVSVFCGDTESYDDEMDVAHNPTAIFEILSPSTEGFDRGRKFESYRSIEQLKAYVLVSQDKPLVEVFRRDTDGWLLQTYSDGVVTFPEFDAELNVQELYDRVRFTDEP